MDNIDISLHDDIFLRFKGCELPLKNQIISLNGCNYIVKDRIFYPDENRVVILTDLYQQEEGQ